MESSTTTTTDLPLTSHFHNHPLREKSVENNNSIDEEQSSSIAVSVDSCDDYYMIDDVDMSVNHDEFLSFPVDVQMEWYINCSCV